MPALSARDSTMDCPRRQGKLDRRNDRICHRPTTTGSRNTTTPAAQPPSNRLDTERFDTDGVTAATRVPTPTVVAGDPASAPIPNGRNVVGFSITAGTPTWSGGMSKLAAGSSNITPNIAASNA